MLAENSNRAAHQEPYAGQDAVQFPEQDLSVPSAFNLGTKSADDARSSISSDKSDSKPPRSAMRRTSSVSKLPQSPRRVRFDFMGEEVLPTSSPQQIASIAARISSPEPTSHEDDCTSNLATDPGEDEEEEPPPRKVSSSDALRALSRAPFDEDGTVWTVVNSDSGDSATEASQFTQSQHMENPDALTDMDAAPIFPGFEGRTDTFRSQMRSETTVSDTIAHNVDKPEDDSTDDEDILSMAKHKAPPSRAYRAPRMLSSLSLDKKVASDEANGKSLASSNCERADLPESRDEAISCAVLASDQREDGAIFYCEEDDLQFPNQAYEQKPGEQEQEHSEEEHSDLEIDTVPISLYATSPAIAIPTRQMEVVDLEQSTSTMSSRSKFQTDTVGSYNGRPLLMPIVRNAELLEKLTCVHDRSPADDSKSSTIQAFIDERLAAGAPRSFKERLLLEDMMEAARASPRTSKKKKL